MVRRSFEIWKSRDLSDVPDLTHPDFVLDLSRNIFNPDLYRGTDGIRLFFERVDEMWDELEVNAEEIIDGDDRVVVASRLKESAVTESRQTWWCFRSGSSGRERWCG